MFRDSAHRVSFGGDANRREPMPDIEAKNLTAAKEVVRLDP
jgi:hypothetical protein